MRTLNREERDYKVTEPVVDQDDPFETVGELMLALLDLALENPRNLEKLEEIHKLQKPPSKVTNRFMCP